MSYAHLPDFRASGTLVESLHPSHEVLQRRKMHNFVHFLFSRFHHLYYIRFEPLEPHITTVVSLIVFFDANNDTVLLTLLKNSGIITLHRSLPYERS